MTLGEFTNVMGTVYNLVGDVSHLQQTLNREIWVNESRVIGIEFDQANNRETFYDKNRTPLLTITFDQAGLPLSYQPHEHGHYFNITYDKFNRIGGWSWGPTSETYGYDRRSRLAEISNELDGTRYVPGKELPKNQILILPSLQTIDLQRFQRPHENHFGQR